MFRRILVGVWSFNFNILDTFSQILNMNDSFNEFYSVKM